MSPTVLVSKLSMPRLANLVHRPRLVEQLDQAIEYPLVVVQSAAGFGKTHLIYDWLQHNNHHVCWLSLDAMNNVPSEFWRYICASIEGLHPNITAEAQALLSNSYIDDVSEVCDRLITALNQFTRHRLRPNHCVLVLEDLHHIDHETILSSLSRFIDHKPYWLQVVITSRALPALRLPYRLSQKQASVINAQDLNYTLEECQQVLIKELGQSIDETVIQDIYDKSHGWPAAVQLLGLSIRHTKLKPGSYNLNSEFLSEYLMEEIYSNLDPNTQVLLCIACLLPNFNKAALSFITQTQVSKSEYDAVLNSGLIRQEHEDTVSLHELFRQRLEQYLTENRPQDIQSWRKAALAWLVDAEQFEAAFILAIKMQYWARAAQILGDLFIHPSKIGHLDYLDFLLNHFTQAHIKALPKLGLFQSILYFSQFKKSLLHESLKQTQLCLNQLEDTLSQIHDPNQHADILFAAGIKNSLEFNELIQAMQILKDLVCLFDGKVDQLKCIDEVFQLSERHPMYSWWYYLQFVHAFMREDFPQAIALGKKTLKIARENNDALCCITTASWLSHGLYQHGDLKSAFEYCLDVQTWLAEINALNLPNITALYGALGFLYVETRDVENAWRMYEKVEASITPFSEPREVVFNQYHLKFRLLMCSQEFDAAQACIDDIVQFEKTHIHQYEHASYSAMPDVSILNALLQLKRNNVMPIIEWAMQYSEQQPMVAMKQNFEQFIRIIGLTLSGQDLSEEHQQLINTAQSSKHVSREISLSLFKCSYLYAQGEHQAAQEIFHKTVSRAYALGYRQLILDAGHVIISLLENISPTSNLVEIRETLLHKVEYAQPSTTTSSSATHSSLTKEAHRHAQQFSALTPRETEILEQVAQGKRNQDIAATLRITLPTVKRHIQNIYSKLDIHSRTEAALLFNAIKI
ncbi:MAG: hypothetical protein HWE18_02680 [Gammaproteobacteria bacterium]|nr:hypothetical protein [Gammaproteobacteria bacterium]